MINDLNIIALKVIKDDRGDILHMLREDADHYAGFGEVYFSEIKPDEIKAWKKNNVATQSLSVPFGHVRFVMYDDREHSPTFGVIQVVELGREENYSLLQIPPKVWYGFSCAGPSPSLISNCSNMLHDPSHASLLPIENTLIPYTWSHYECS
jgi:dTDP-4-dehydrorhamnose 3,5-epimerase|tara:strand:- start:85 stop:540 length:456 start_codon:yes stop_codon:yes gene_type:complete